MGCGRMIYIIAGNHTQAKNWMRKKHLIENKEAKYIHCDLQLNGLPNKLIVVYIGTFYEHNNFHKIRFVLDEMEAIELTEIEL